LLKGLVLMAGVFTRSLAGAPLREWNAMGDPHASAIVFRAPVPSVLAVGLDVTLRCRLDAAECRRRLRGRLLSQAAAMAEVWFRHADRITFHDPLAAAVIFEPDLCRYEQGRVEVELAGERLAGLTHWRREDGGPHHIAVDVDADALFRHYFAVAGEG
jgi:purine nucleosidase